MDVRAAVSYAAGQPLVVETVQLEGPKAGEVLVEIKATGICHTDEFTRSGADPEGLFPAIFGHEGAGIVVDVGPGVTSLKKGDHVIPLYTPECRQCKSCLSRKTNLCTAIRGTQGKGVMPDGTSRFSIGGKKIHHYMGCSTFSNYTVLPEIALARIREDAPFDKVCYIGCGVTTGIGAVINTAKVEPGANVVVFGLGGIGLNVVQGARLAGANMIVGVDLNPARKPLAEKFGMTHFVNPKDASHVKADDLVAHLVELTGGGADYSFECIGNVEVMRQALECCHRGWGVSVKELSAQKSLVADTTRSQIENLLASMRLPPDVLDSDPRGILFAAPEDLIGTKNGYLAVLGLQDQIYPPRASQNPILGDLEREALNLQAKASGCTMLTLSGLPEHRRDILEKLCLSVTEGLRLQFESHNLDSGNLTTPSSFLFRALTALGAELNAKTLYNFCGVQGSFVSGRKVTALASLDRYILGRQVVSASLDSWQSWNTVKTALGVTSMDGVEHPEVATGLLERSWSPTTLETFFKCPYQFYLKHILGIPEQEEEDGDGALVWLDPKAYGKFLHSVFERLVRPFTELPKAGSVADWIASLNKIDDKVIAKTIDQVEAEPEFTELKAGVPDTVIARERYAILTTTRTFVEKEKIKAADVGAVPVAVEEKFDGLTYDLLVDGESVSLKFKGTVDRLDRVGKERFCMVDYKTGANRYKDNGNLFCDGNDTPHIQHVIYGLWATHSTKFKVAGDKLESGYYFTSEKGGWETISAGFPTFANRFEQAMTVFVKALKLGEFRKNSKACQYCNFHLVCLGVPKTRGEAPQIVAVANAIGKLGKGK